MLFEGRAPPGVEVVEAWGACGCGGGRARLLAHISLDQEADREDDRTGLSVSHTRLKSYFFQINLTFLKFCHLREQHHQLGTHRSNTWACGRRLGLNPNILDVGLACVLLANLMTVIATPGDSPSFSDWLHPPVTLTALDLHMSVCAKTFTAWTQPHHTLSYQCRHNNPTDRLHTWVSEIGLLQEQ